ncbi:MAG: hypothetical protein ACUVRT_03740 [Armatimonadota bacterium]
MQRNVFRVIWVMFTCLLIGTVRSAVAHHDLDLLFGHEDGHLTIIQPAVHPVRSMVRVQSSYLLDVGVDFFTPDGSLYPMLSQCRMVKVWISDGLVGTKSGMGVIFSSGNTPNAFDLPTGGTPHHHFVFSASSPGIYVFDLQAVRGVAFNGAPLNDMPYPYRIYMVAGNPSSLRGNVQPSTWYVGNPYHLWLTVYLLRDGQVTHVQQQPINPFAVHTYMVGFNTSGTYQAVAKLDKHLSVSRTLNLAGSQTWNLQLPVLGDVNDDDKIDSDDVQQVCTSFGQYAPSSDLNGDGQVNLDDLYPTLFYYGQVGGGMR